MNVRSRILLVCVVSVSGCADRLDHLGRAPTVTAPGAPEALQIAPPAPERVALVPAAPLPRTSVGPASLWSGSGTSLYSDRRARSVGDLVTVVIAIDDEAEISNRTARARDGSDEISISALLGLPSVADVVFPGAGTLTPAVSTGGTQGFDGSGSVSREEQVTLRLAATVEQVLPNGHLVIRGTQEMRINFELRDLQISGIVRPEDISRRNEIQYDRIADARIIYGGRGQITDVQQPRYGQQVIDIIAPF